MSKWINKSDFESSNEILAINVGVIIFEKFHLKSIFELSYHIIFYHIVLFALFHSSLIILFILFVSMPMNLLLLLLIRIRSPQLLSMLPTAQRQPQQNTERIRYYVENRGDERKDGWMSGLMLTRKQKRETNERSGERSIRNK